MKTSQSTNAVISLIALLSRPAFSKKDDAFLVFRTTRAKADKETTDASFSPSQASYSDSVATKASSKASKETVGAKVLKNVLISKADKAKCLEEDINLSESDLMMDMSSFSLSSSMSYSMPMGSRASKEMTKCYKINESTKHGKGSLETTDNDVSMGDDEWSVNDDGNWSLFIRLFLEKLSICDGSSLNFDSCLVENMITAIAYPSDVSPGRMLRAASNSTASREMQSVESAGDDWQRTNECTLPSEDEIKIVVNQATSMCADAGVQISSDEYTSGLDSFLSIFTNEVCMCAW